MKLKNYQKQAIKKLSYFCSEIQKDNISEADILGKNYFSIQENLPYLCFKIPTGGGKTFIASVSLKEIIRNYLKSDFYLVFWLAP